MKSILCALFMYLLLLNNVKSQNASLPYKTEPFYVTKFDNTFFIYLGIDSSKIVTYGAKRHVFYSQFKAGPFNCIELKKLKKNESERMPWLFSGGDSYNAVRIYLGRKDTTILGFRVTGYLFKEVFSLGREDYYGISCYDPKYLVPTHYFSFEDSSFLNCYSIRINKKRLIKPDALEIKPLKEDSTYFKDFKIGSGYSN